MKRIEIISLARKKSEKRGILEEWIRETINFPTQIIGGHEGWKVAQRKYIVEGKKYLLRVIYEEEKEKRVVITAYLTSQIERYLKEEK